ncbi:MAG TPA: DUF4405 domain-containing protein, partial [Armatimonadetes bacterium]|nr:DUF4405 domain-containing protein [Armatimonadota bacterium]
MDRLKLNLLISALMFLCVMAITGTALLARFVLGADETLMMFGMDHDGWETIHFIFGCTFLTLLALHIILHWHAIVHLYRRSIPSQTARVVI